MRTRKPLVLFWATCTLVPVLILEVTTDQSTKLPNIRPVLQASDDLSASTDENKSAAHHIVEKTLIMQRQIQNEHTSERKDFKDYQKPEVVNASGALEPLRDNKDKRIATPKENMSQYALRNESLPATDVQRHAAVESKSAVNHTMESTHNVKRKIQIEHTSGPKNFKDFPIREVVSGAQEPLRDNKDNRIVAPKVDMLQCALLKESLPETDVQMLSLYSKIEFDDVDGGVWKQGWDIQYKKNQWTKKSPLKVFIVPHSHNDPGWLRTFEDYYKADTKAIFTRMVQKLTEVPNRKFIWCETSFLSLWWATDATEEQKATFKRLLNSGNIEIVTGGWVMNDEANSHFLSIIQQLTTGHQWLLDNLQYIPKNHWSIDPFGYSSTQPYLLKLAGFENSVIQRVHYRIKKELAINKQLEFRWRQLWDGLGSTDLLTHLMPFNSYNIPNSCGPDPKVCSQFDFLRYYSNDIQNRIDPVTITDKSILERSILILDQWRKKAQLFRSNVVLFPLGDDFRYVTDYDWNVQYRNYEKLIHFINNNDSLHAKVQFGTLEDYFQALHEEVKISDFPVLSGDFFTYADRNEHYWSGYYTSRPFYKRMDRVLLGYVRAAETITAQLVIENAADEFLQYQLRDHVEAARRALALFQHHDAITGTSRSNVVEDYAKKMHKAIQQSQFVIQKAAYYLLKQPTIKKQTGKAIFFDLDDIWQQHDAIPTRITLGLNIVTPSRKIVLYNALIFNRTEILTILVTTHNIIVFNPHAEPILIQVSPVTVVSSFQSDERLGIAKRKYQVSFPVTVPALGLTTYTVALRQPKSNYSIPVFANVRVFNLKFLIKNFQNVFPLKQPLTKLDSDIQLKVGNSSRLVLNKHGLLKAVITMDGSTFPLSMDFIQYNSTNKMNYNSGAYLFIPSGPGRNLSFEPHPKIVVIEGPYMTTASTVLDGSNPVKMIISVSIYNNPSLPQTEIEITNTMLIGPPADDLEVSLRFTSRVRNGDVFYTDLNGMQMIKRRYQKKLPLQANWYPLPAAAYIQDSGTRLTLLTSTPLGVAATQPGQIEVMQDRRLSNDDGRGLGQGVLDNVRTRHIFRLLVEPAATPCQRKVHADHPSGQLTLGAHLSAQMLLQPLVRMQYWARGEASPCYSRPFLGAPDLVLGSFRAFVSSKLPDGSVGSGLGLVLQRADLELCYGSAGVTARNPLSHGVVHLKDYFGPLLGAGRAYTSTLTFARAHHPAGAGLALCPMEAQAVFLNHTMYRTKPPVLDSKQRDIWHILFLRNKTVRMWCSADESRRREGCKDVMKLLKRENFTSTNM